MNLNLDLNGLDDYLNNFVNQVQDESIRVLKFIGEKCVTEARNSGVYNNITGNLRASVGYAIISNGSVIDADINHPESQSTINRISGGFRDTTLVIVAGMNYASYVEAKGKNVLISAEQLAEREAPLLLKQILR